MADEVTFSTHVGELRIAAVLAQLVHEQLMDKTDLRPFIKYYGSVGGTGSDTLKVSSVSWDDEMKAPGEGAAQATVTDVTATKADIAVARYALAREITDLFSLTGGAQHVALQDFADNMAHSARKAFMDQLSTLINAISASVGTSGDPTTVDDLYSAIQTLRAARAQGPLIAVLHPDQMNNLEDSLRGEGQALHPADAASLLGLPSDQVPAGFEGTFAGTAIYTHEDVGDDVIGGVFDRQWAGWADGVPDLSAVGATAMSAGDNVLVEIDRLALEGETQVVGNYYFGIAEIEGARGVKIVSGV